MRLSSHPVTLRQLQYAVAVADSRSFRGAAQACHVSQPSLSAQVAQLESALGVRLFERDKRTVTVTSAGEALVARARALLLSADGLVDAAQALSDPLAGTLRLGVIPTVGPYLLPEVAPLLGKRFPRLLVVWTEEKTAVLVEKLARGEVDAAILALESELPPLSHLVLGRDEFVLAARSDHELASSRRRLKPKDLAGQDVLLLDDGHCFRDQALSVCTRAHAHESEYRATSISTLVQMAASGLGVTLLPELALAVENRRHTLRTLPFAPKAPHRTVALAWRRGSAREPTLRPVGAVLREAYERLTRSSKA